MDLKLEVVILPVSDVDRAKQFYKGLGWREDADIVEYPGKVRLIATGFGEAATAVNNAAVAIDPAAHLFPGHSSEAG